MRPLHHLALASVSPRRRALLVSVGLDVQIIASAYREAPLAGHDPRRLAMAHARGKALGAAGSAALIVAADTVVDLDGVALGKPRDTNESCAMLARLSGRDHLVHTAYALRDDERSALLVEVETTRVWFGALSQATIEAYAASGDGLDKAGAYGIQGFAATLVERIDGDYFTVVGFPLATFARALPRIGYELRAPGAYNIAVPA